MTSYRNILLLLLVLVFTATSCKKDGPTPESPVEEEKYETVPLTITIGITPMSGDVDGTVLKQSFANGDVIEITNHDLLYEPLIISTNGNEGKTSATFNVEMKVKKNAELVSGSSQLTAVLKNGTKYNEGKPYEDVKQLSSLNECVEQYSYWSCENFTYNADNISINLTQSTVFLNINLFGAKVTMKYGLGFYSEIVSGNCFYAVPFGTTIECNGLNLQQCLDVKDKYLYRIGFSVPTNCLNGLFSVGENKAVFFSKGNLQYRPMDGTWRLAPQQMHRCFTATKSFDLGENYANWMGEDKWTDLFYWESLNDCISAYGSEWSLLSIDEWNYLCEQRPNAKNKRGGAIVNGVEGWVILPDDWVSPEGVTQFDGDYEVKYAKDIPNVYTLEEWTKMESAGAVFLPGTGYLSGTKFQIYVSFLSIDYQTLSYDEVNDWGMVMSFNDMMNSSCRYNRSYPLTDAFPVRLVQFKAENSEIKVE